MEGYISRCSATSLPITVCANMQWIDQCQSFELLRANNQGEGEGGGGGGGGLGTMLVPFSWVDSCMKRTT